MTGDEIASVCFTNETKVHLLPDGWSNNQRVRSIITPHNKSELLKDLVPNNVNLEAKLLGHWHTANALLQKILFMNETIQHKTLSVSRTHYCSLKTAY